MIRHRLSVLVLFGIVSSIGFASLKFVAAEDSTDKVDEGELKKLQGDWIPISTAVNLKETKFDEKNVPPFSYSLSGRTLTVFREGKEAGKMEIKHLVPKNTFGEMDWVTTEMKGKPAVDNARIKMIYKLNVDELTNCADLPGKDRPTEFATKPGTTVRLTVMKVKPKTK